MIHPDIPMPVKQCARLFNDPRKEHEEAVKCIFQCLLRVHRKGLLLKPHCTRSLECWVDADWDGSWQHRSSHDPLSDNSCTDFIIMYSGCPILWKSSMQKLVALSTAEAEYISLSSALREVITITNLLEEIKGKGFDIHAGTPNVKCKTFKDNKSCIEIATNHKTCPLTKHLSVHMHHFRSHIVQKNIYIEHVYTNEMLADILTKPLPNPQCKKLRDLIMGWTKS